MHMHLKSNMVFRRKQGLMLVLAMDVNQCIRNRFQNCNARKDAVHAAKVFPARESSRERNSVSSSKSIPCSAKTAFVPPQSAISKTASTLVFARHAE